MFFDQSRQNPAMSASAGDQPPRRTLGFLLGSHVCFRKDFSLKPPWKLPRTAKAHGCKGLKDQLQKVL